MTTTTDLPSALAAAVAAARAAAGDPTGTVLLLAPGETSGAFARQTLADAGPVVRVEAATPEGLVRALAAGRLPGRPEPAGWRSATLGVLLRQLAARGALGAHGATLARPGWREPVAGALAALEDAGLDAEALRGHVPADPALAERAALLAALLEALAARRAEEGLVGRAALAAAALRGVGSGAPVERAVGAVILGDTRLPAGTFAVVRAFLARRPVVRVALPPLDAVPAEACGLVAAAPHARVVAVAPAAGALGGLQARLFRGEEGPPLALDATLALGVAPDEVREAREAARAVLDAVRAGTPLDRIAVALPGTERAAELRAALGEAGIPATWLTGPPLGREPTARFVRLLCDLAAGDDTVARWYELLRQPGLRLRARLGPPGTTGRGRWRRILASCGAVRGTAAIARAVAAWAAARPAEAEGDREAAAALLTAMGALSAELAAWTERAPLGVHAGRIDAFLDSWWARSRDREQVRQLLRGWASSTAGFPFALGEGADELADALAGTPALEGRTTDPAVRIASPMALLGGAFDVVIAPGLAHGRFPAEPRENPLLPDALARAWSAALGVDLPTSDRAAAEDARRFAAAAGACRGRLVLSWPATDLLDGRPRLPGELALAVAASVRGRRAGYRDLAGLAARVGSRARPHAEDPERALGDGEHLLARAARDRAGAVGWLAAAPGTRRLLAQQRSPWRLRREGVRDAWSGALPPALRAGKGLDGAPLTVAEVSDLLRDPARFLFRRTWGAWPARPLPDGLDLLDRWAARSRLADAVRAAMDAGGDLDAEVRRAWAAALDAATTHVPAVDPADRALADALAEADWAGARGHLAPRAGPSLAIPPTPLADGLPWTVAGPVGQQAGAAVVQVAAASRTPDAADEPGALVAALAAQRAGHAVTEAVSAGLDGVAAAPLAPAVVALTAGLAAAAARAEAGTWPWSPDRAFRLADEEAE